MKLRFVFIILIFVVPLLGQDVSVVATIDSQSVSLGDYIHLSIEVKHPAGVGVSLPVLKDTLGPFDIVHQDSIQQRDENGTVILTKNIIISKYDGGNFYVPPIVVGFNTNEGKRDSVASNPIPVEVRGVQVDTTQAIKDVKGQLTVPISAEEIALYAGIFVLLCGIGYGAYYYIKKKRNTGFVFEDDAPKIPPHIIAIQKLFDLDEAHVWQSGDVKRFYSEATEIVREYFEKRYGISALEMTTGEVMDQLDKFTLDVNTSRSIEQFLSGADLVKFAKYQPVSADNEEVIPTAKMIVEKTKPILVIEPQPEAANQSEAATANV
jgi:hypothetical protein